MDDTSIKLADFCFAQPALVLGKQSAWLRASMTTNLALLPALPPAEIVVSVGMALPPSMAAIIRRNV